MMQFKPDECGRQYAWLRDFFSRTRKLCQVDLISADGQSGDGSEKQENRTQTLRVPKWSQWAELFFHYFTLKLIAALYLQHEYNQVNYQLKHLSEQPSGGNQTTTTRRQLVNSLEQRLALERAHIELLGNPYFEFGIDFEPPVLNILTLNMLIYTFAKFIIKLKETSRSARCHIHISLLGLLLPNSQVEHQFIASQVLAETENIAVSLSAQPLTEDELQRALHLSSTTTTTTTWRRSNEQSPPLRGKLMNAKQQQNERKSLIAQDLRRSARYGFIKPLNRHDEWINQLFANCAQFVVVENLLAIPFMLTVLVLVPLSNVLELELHTSPRDLLFGIELFVYTLLGQQAACFYLALLHNNCQDQIKFVHALQASIGELVHQTRALNLAQVATPTLSSTSKLNLNIATMLVQYRLFSGQLKLSKPLVGLGGGIAFCLMISMPLVGRAYMSFLNLNERYLMVFLSVGYVMVCDFIIIPNCYLHARCLDLIRHLSSLLAHLMDDDASLVLDNNNSNNNNSSSQCGRLYDEQLVCVLRRELENPQIVMKRFVTNGFFLRLTYTDLLAVHFWCGLVLASLLLTDLSRIRAHTGNLFVDSLISL